MINLMDYQNQPYYCGGVRGQAGHGTAEGCSSLFTGSDDVCTNELHFYHNSGKTRIGYVQGQSALVAVTGNKYGQTV